MPARGTRRIIVDDQFLKRAEEVAAVCYTDSMIWDALGIKSKSFYDLMRKNPHFAQTIKRAQAKKTEKVLHKFHKKIEEGDITAIIFFLKCRAGWIEAEKRKALSLKKMELELRKDELELKAMIAAKFTPKDAVEFLEKYGSIAA